MKRRWYERLLPPRKRSTWLRSVTTGSLYRISNLRLDNSLQDIRNQIRVMRSLAEDSQVATALSYYASDATTLNTDGQIIWAVPTESKYSQVAKTINTLFDRWNINRYVREHILELATIGNLYIPTTETYRMFANSNQVYIGLDANTLVDKDYDIIPSTKLPPENILHVWQMGEPVGFIYQQDDYGTTTTLLPESSIIHFSLGGMLGDYTIDMQDGDTGERGVYDILFAQPLMERALRPTQTLNLVEDSIVLSSLSKVVRFINVDVGGASEEEEIRAALADMKNMIEQQLSLNTITGDAQSYVNPQSPNNLIFLPKINGQDMVSVTDLNMQNPNESVDALLEYYQDKKLSVLGVPKEAMNFSSSEGLGGAGAVMSQRSAIYANSLQRIETAYIEGWTDAINKYFIAKGFSGFVGNFKLKMNPITTLQSTINFEKRDSALSQAAALVELLGSLNVDDISDYKDALVEVLSDALPKTGSNVMNWDIEIASGEEEMGGL